MLHSKAATTTARRRAIAKLACACLSAALLGTVDARQPLYASDIIVLPPKPVTPAQKRFQAGIAALDNNDLTTAETAFKDSSKLDPRAAAPYMGLAQVAFRRGQKEAGEGHLKKALSLAPNDASIQASWGAYLYTQRDLPAAEAALRKAVGLDASQAAAHIHLGDMYLVAFRKAGDAVKEYRAAISADPQHPGAHYALGVALATQGDAANAEKELLQARQLAPTNPLPPQALGQLYESQNQLDKALASFDAALKIMPAFAAAHVERGQLLAAKGDDASALKAFTEAQKADPKRSVGYTNIGMLHQRNQRWSDAEQAYLSAIKIEPGNAVAYNNLAWMTAERKTDLARGLEWAKKAVSLSPSTAEFQVTLGWVYRAQGDTAKAEQTLRNATSLKPQKATAAYYLGKLYVESGKKQEAVAELKKALALEPNFSGATDARAMLKQLGAS